MKQKSLLLSILLSSLSVAPLYAETKYWDIDGPTPGAGGATPAGNWDTTTANWTTDSTGSLTGTTFTSGADSAVFSAGTDAAGTFLVTAPSAITASTIVVEEGNVQISDSGAAVTTGAVTINSGSTLSSPGTALLLPTGTPNMTLSGGTFENRFAPATSTGFLNAGFKMVLSGGGTISAPGGGGSFFTYVPSTGISGTGPLTISGSGCGFRMATKATYTGATTITPTSGTFEFRQQASASILPTTTDLTINSGAVFNLGAQNATVASLSGSGIVAFGQTSGRLTVNGSLSTTFSGVIQDSFTTFGAPTGLYGGLIKNGTSVLTLSGVNAMGGINTLTAGGLIVTPGASLCATNADLIVNGGTLTLNNTAQTIENLTGSGGSIVLGDGHTLTITGGNFTSGSGQQNYQGVISGAGNIILNGVSSAVIQTNSGVNTYSGTTTINKGTLSLMGAGSMANSPAISIASGAALKVTGRTDGTLSLGSAQTLSGSGTVSGMVAVNGIISPGTNGFVGKLNTGTNIWNGGGSYKWEMNQAAGTAGTNSGWDQLNITGALTIAATPGNPFTININSLTLDNTPGAVSDFDNSIEYSWSIAKTTTGITGFDTNAFVLNTNGFANSLNGGVLRITTNATDVLLVYRLLSSVQPVILVQPQSQTNYVGADVTFSVGATGGNLLYQWRFEGSNIADATNSALVLTNIQFTNAGNYSVIVSNTAGFAISDNALLTVEVLPLPGDRHWSADGSTVGGTGTWNTSAYEWGLSTAGPFNLKWNNTNLDNAIFSAPAGTVTIGEPITVNKITMTNSTSAAYVFAGTNTITFAGSGAGVFVQGANNGNTTTNHVNFNGKLTGPVVTKSGGGRMVMNNTNNSVGKWVVAKGAIAGGSADVLFGTGIPATLVTDFVTLDDGGLGFGAAGALTVGANRGIYLGTNGGRIGNNGTGGIITIDGPISGPGDLHFPGTTEFPGQVQGDNCIYIISNTNNTYGGWTRIATAEVRLGNHQVFPATTTLNITNGTINGRLNLNGKNQTVVKVILDSTTGSSRITDSVGGGSLSAGEFELRRTASTEGVSAVLAGSGFMTKTTTGNIPLGALNTYSGDTYLNDGTITLNGVGRFGNGAGTLHLDNGDIVLSQTRTEENTLLNPVIMTAETVFQSSATVTNDIVFRSGGTWTTTGGILYLFNPGTNWFELVLTNTVVFSAPVDIGALCRLTSLNPTGSEQTFSGGISGAGTFRRSGDGGRTIFAVENSYSGGTVVEAGSLVVNNTTGSGTGTGSVTVNAPSGVLGGTGIIAGNVVVNNGGSIAPGSGTGILTLQSGLNMTNGGTMVWELATLKDNSNGTAGTDFDQLVLSGGELELGGSSKLSLQFAAGTAPNAANAFWQTTRSWTIVSLSGGLNTANASIASIVNGSYSAGNFSTTVSGGNIVLTFAPSAQTEPSITTHPQSRTNIVGTTASFTVVATGSEPLNYSWYRSTAPFTAITGATNATFTIPNVQAGDVGSYFARVNNDLGTATSQTASLTLASRPSLQPLTMTSGGTKAVIAWNTLAGTQYQLQYNTNLATTNWYLITNIVGTGSSISTTNTVPAGERERYFRLNVQ